MDIFYLDLGSALYFACGVLSLGNSGRGISDGVIYDAVDGC